MPSAGYEDKPQLFCDVSSKVHETGELITKKAAGINEKVNQMKFS
jgi:hypothetical protein